MSTRVAPINSDRIQDALYAFTRSQILFTAIDLDVFSYVAAGHTTWQALQKHLDLDERGIRILLNGLVGIGFLQRNADKTYRLPPDAEQFLVRDSSDYLGGMVHHCKRLYDNWSLLTDAVRSGQPVGGAQSLAQLESYFSELVKGLYVSNYPTARKLADLLKADQPDAGLQVLDVAGGSAVWSIALLEKNKQSQATIIDFPSVIHVAESYVAQHALQDRYTYWSGDLEDYQFPAVHFDVALLANICHALGPISTQRAFKRLAKTLKPGGRLAIVDFVPNDQSVASAWPFIFGVNMLITSPEGNVFTENEYRRWLAEAGFSNIVFHEIEQDVMAIVASL